MSERTEFGYHRSVCACNNCQVNCQYIPGYLIPADLKRIVPSDVDILKWAEENLLASPGATVYNTRTKEKTQIPTLVPATKPDGSCKFLTEDLRCSIHEVSPFGCAFFSCTQTQREADIVSFNGLKSIMENFDFSEYGRVWYWLNSKGLRSKSANEKRKQMGEKRHESGRRRNNQ